MLDTTLISLGSAIAAIAMAWGLAKAQLRSLKDDHERLRFVVDKQFSKTDALVSSLDVTKSKVEAMSAVMSPASIMQWTREDQDFRARTDERLKALENGQKNGQKST